jgi:adenine specific DNA methylase Mod
MAPRLVELRRVLKPTGSLFLHCDPTMSHYLKILLDSIFGAAFFRNEIVWKRANTVKGNFGQGQRALGANTDTILFYAKTKNSVYHQIFTDYTDRYLDGAYRHTERGTGRRYRLISMIGPGGAAKGNPSYEVMGVTRHWRYSEERMRQLIDTDMVVQTRPGAVPQRKQYLDEGKGVALQSNWTDIPSLQAGNKESLGYPTQKPLALLERVLRIASDEGGTVLDPFCGCGTTIDAAQRLNRRWIGVDAAAVAIDFAVKRLRHGYGEPVLGTFEVLDERPAPTTCARGSAPSPGLLATAAPSRRRNAPPGPPAPCAPSP